MAVKSKPVVTLTMPSDRELVITALLDAPRDLVFEATTKPEHLKRWWGIRRTTMTVCDIDLRPGGAWRYVVRDNETGREDGFSGIYREITPPERLVSTEGCHGPPRHDYIVPAPLYVTDRTPPLTIPLHSQSAD